MKNPFNIRDIKLDKIIFSKASLNENSKNIYLKYNNNGKLSRFLIQTTELEIKDIQASTNDVTIILVNLKSNNNKKLNNFVNFIYKLDNHIIETGKSNPEWFYSNNVKFKGLIRQDADCDIPYLKLKIKNYMLKNLQVTYDKQSEKKSFKDLKKHDNIKLVLDIFGLWVNKNGFGLYLKPVLIDIRDSNELTFYESSEDNDIIDTEKNIDALETPLNLMIESPTKISMTEINDEKISSDLETSFNRIDLIIKDSINDDNIIKNINNSSSDISDYNIIKYINKFSDNSSSDISDYEYKLDTISDITINNH